jgi:pyruvate, water dikinase
MIVPLMEADGGTCGGKAGALGALLRAGLPVPDGFVVPFAVYLAAVGEPEVPASVAEALAALGDPPVAVRSSAAGEDSAQASAAGQYESVLGVQGAEAVADAVRTCWASLFSPRAVSYRDPGDDPVMAVIVQRQVDAEASGVMFTGEGPDGATGIEASWGLGPSVVGGTVSPDAFRVAADGSITRTIADKRTRLDRHGTRLVTSDVPEDDRRQPSIDDATVRRLAELGQEVAAALGGPQDIEWAIAGNRIWVLQARPITAAPPPPSVTPTTGLAGTPGSHGNATGAARIVRGPSDFARVRPGDILVCPFTDPAWTPLLRIVGGVVTETGGVLSHAAIVAREQAIPAVLGVQDATSRLSDGALVTIDGTTGTVTPG